MQGCGTTGARGCGGAATGALRAASTPAASAGASAAPPSNPLVARARAGLQGSSIARQVFDALDRSGADIRTLSDSAFAAQFGARTKGAFDPNTNRISLPESVAGDPERLRQVLLHEGVHWLQENVPGGAEGLGGPIADALTGAGAVRPTRPNTKADMQHDETQAYVLDAIIARELGFRDNGLGTDRATGRALGYDAVLERIRATPEYT